MSTGGPLTPERKYAAWMCTLARCPNAPAARPATSAGAHSQHFSLNSEDAEEATLRDVNASTVVPMTAYSGPQGSSYTVIDVAYTAQRVRETHVRDTHSETHQGVE